MERERTGTISVSSEGLKASIILTGILAVAICMLVTIIFRIIGYGTYLETFIVFILWICLPLMWLTWAWITWSKWSKTAYIMGDESLIVRKPTTFGSTEQLYRYDSILTVQVIETFWSKNLGYGQVRITIPKLEQPVVLNYVENPDNQVREIKKQISIRDSGSKALIT